MTLTISNAIEPIEGILRSESRGRGYKGCAPHPNPPDMTYGFLVQLVFCKRKTFCGLLDEFEEFNLNAVKRVVNFLVVHPLLLLRKILDEDLPLILLSTVNVLIEALSKRSKLLIKGSKNIYHVVRIRGQLQMIASL